MILQSTTRYLSLFCFLFLCASFVSAQVQLYAIPHESTINRQMAREGLLALPFFDDFSSSDSISEMLWEPGSGASLNNSAYGMELAPSKNIVTLDGLSSNGMPYDFSSFNEVSATDTLTSQCIDLSEVNPGAGLYLSFFWQEAGLGEDPDIEDSLRLQIKASDASWHTVWVQLGEGIHGEFQQTLLLINDPLFLHETFQFRFQSFGRANGPYDAWNLDYIYLNTGRDENDRFTDDVACVQQVSSFLQNYTAMPLDQYLLDPAAATASSLKTALRNLDDNFRALNYTCTLSDTLNDMDWGELEVFSESPNGQLIFPDEDYDLQARLEPLDPMDYDGIDEAVLKYKFDVITTDALDPVDFTVNDSIVGYTVLRDYYAYDDGSAEYAAGINQKFGKMAVAYHLNEPGYLSDVDISFVPLENDLSSQSFVVLVWSSIEGEEGENILTQKAYAIRYPEDRNGFVRYNMGRIYVEGTFYVGIMQTVNELVAVGFDQNNDTSSQTFYNISGQWTSNENISGTLMIRPVFNKDVVAALPEKELKAITIYPNPNSGVITVKGDFKNATLLDILGKKVSIRRNGQEIYMEEAKTGVYFLHIRDHKGTVHVEKILRQ